MSNYTKDFREWMDRNNLTSESLAPLINRSKGTIENWRSQRVPDRARTELTAFMERYDAEKAAEAAKELVDVINLEVTPEQFDSWNKAALEEGLIIREWAIKGLDEMAQEEFSNITPLPKKADIMAAAGPGIAAEVIDWQGDNDTVSVKICGESMSPLFEDGQIIEMKHKRASRSPFLKKGLIYLVELEGEWMVKRYDNRKPRPEEKDAEYLTATKRVGILKSENPAFQDIDITGPFEWAAWFDQPV